MADRKHAAVHTVKPAVRNLVGNRASAEPERHDLPVGDDSVLSGRHRGDRLSKWMTFCTHVMQKVIQAMVRPLLPAEIPQGEEHSARCPGAQHHEALHVVRQPTAAHDRAAQAVDHVPQRQHSRSGVDHRR